MNIDKLVSELGNYFRVNSKEIAAMVYNTGSVIEPYMRTVTRVKGQFPAINSITSDVIQGFKPEWNEVGETTIKPNILVAYDQKINFPIIPDEIEASWLGELNEEDLDLPEKSISKYIMDKELMPKAQENVNYLMVRGRYNSNALGTFGNSMNGVEKMLELGLLSTDNPMYQIPLSAFTSSSMVDNVTLFEKRIPKAIRGKIKAIFLSEEDLDNYVEDMLNTYPFLVGADKLEIAKSPIKKIPLIGVPEMTAGKFMFATPDGNLLKLVDKFDKPALTDIQKLDYKVKLFFRFHLGVGFWTNQLVFVGFAGGSASGLANSISGTQTYYRY